MPDGMSLSKKNLKSKLINLCYCFLEFLVENVPKYFSLKDVLKAVDTTCGTFNIDKFNGT